MGERNPRPRIRTELGMVKVWIDQDLCTGDEPCDPKNLEEWDCATFVRCFPANSRDERQAIAELYDLDIDGCDFE